jgi:RNA polymerase sigma-70 factor, ECF subfamily
VCPNERTARSGAWDRVSIDLELLVQRHYGRIHRAALVMTGNVWEADDLAQETFLQAMRSAGRFAGQSRIETWLYAILVNQHRRRLRAKGRRERRLVRWLQRAWTKSEHDRPEQRIKLDEWRESIWRHVAELPEDQRHALVLRYSEELSYDEIAQALGCPVGTVRSRLHYGLAALRARLSEGDEPADSQNAGSPLSAKDSPCERSSP